MRTCETKGCNNKHHAKGLCLPCYSKEYRRTGDVKKKAQRPPARSYWGKIKLTDTPGRCALIGEYGEFNTVDTFIRFCNRNNSRNDMIAGLFMRSNSECDVCTFGKRIAAGEEVLPENAGLL